MLCNKIKLRCICNSPEIHLFLWLCVIIACQDWVAHRRCKLDFDDSVGGLRCPAELGEVWQDLLNNQPIDTVGYDYVFAAVKSGIPKLVRGDAWKFLRY